MVHEGILRGGAETPVNPIVKMRAIGRTRVRMVNGTLARVYWSSPREIAIAASVLVRVQFMSRRRKRIETSSPRDIPIRDMQPETPLSNSSLGKVKTIAATPATKAMNSGFGLRLSALT